MREINLLNQSQIKIRHLIKLIILKFKGIILLKITNHKILFKN
jgi:hypothetical protein